MSHTPQAASPARELVEALIGKAIFCFGVARHHARRARTRKILRSLSEEQLRDVGYRRLEPPNHAVHGPVAPSSAKHATTPARAGAP